MAKDKIMKSEVKQRNSVKGCYGTSEWSENSAICGNCKWKGDCGKLNRN